MKGFQVNRKAGWDTHGLPIELGVEKKLGITKVWMQPGSSSFDAIQYCEDNNIDCMHDVCVMLNKK